MLSTIQILTLCLLTVILETSAVEKIMDNNRPCQSGWIPNEGKCYLMRDEYELFESAITTCKLYGSQLAYGTDKNTLTFLSNLVSSHQAFGWWYGVNFDTLGDLYLYDPHRESFLYADMDEKPPLPKNAKASQPATSCVGLIRDFTSTWSLRYLMVDVPCQVKLPYICRGKPQSVLPHKDGDHWVGNGTQDVYWFSSRLDHRSRDEAAKACQDKSMTLLSVRSKKEMGILERRLNATADSQVDPWWIGLELSGGNYSWSDGVHVEPSVINWHPRQRPGSCRILLTNGKMLATTCSDTKAPFICMRQSNLSEEFGCPAKWLRAGTSCYLMSTRENKRVSQPEGERICSKAGAHLISFDTPIEKLWLMKSTLNVGAIWTSLKYRNGQKVWADGSTPSPRVLIWSKGNYMRENGNCFSIFDGVLKKSKCEEYRSPGCMYSAKNGTCVSDRWQYFQEMCYWKVGSTAQSSYFMMLQICYADVVKYDNSIDVIPLKMDSRDVLEMYDTMGNYLYYWIGLTENSHGVYTWSDGTSANISNLPTFDEQEPVLSTDKCAIINTNGEFEVKSCTGCQCGRAVCEKALHTLAQINGGARPLSSSLVYILTMSVIGTVVTQRL